MSMYCAMGVCKIIIKKYSTGREMDINVSPQGALTFRGRKRRKKKSVKEA